MDIWDDSQPDGPEPQPWKQQPQPPRQDMWPHGFIEPSMYALLDTEAARRQKHWHRLLADNVAPHDVWWVRLMKCMKGR